MLKSVRVLAMWASLCGAISAQSVGHPKFLDRARIQHGNSGVTVTANDSLPLFQALYAIRLEYGWQINWEEAPGYSHFDVVDDTASKWRASHPGEKGVTRPSGGMFTGTFTEPNEASGSEAERLALSRLVEEYNTSDNPGKYAVRVDADGQVTIIGTAVKDETGALKKISPLLDTPVTVPQAMRSVSDTIELILTTLESAADRKVIFGAESRSLFMTTQATVGGEGVPARELLKQALASTKRTLQYDLSFDPDVPVYILNVSPTIREEEDGSGGRKLVPAPHHSSEPAASVPAVEPKD